ncbi:GntR family transcriptional regulator [Streptomyces sp. 8K308]|nr:GntR family transcriptional regulator [Streptomyces sp. 8K308]
MTPLRQSSLGERVAHELRVLVISGELKPGARLVEGPLAEQFGVSRGPIRDALKQLETEGLLESQRRGVVVKGLTEVDVDELYTLRQSLESLALTRTMRAATAESWAQAEEAVRLMRAAAERRDARAFAEADLAFHSTFYAHAGHRRLAAVWEQYLPTFAVVLDITVARDVDLMPALESHEQLLALARSGDITAALTELEEHLLGARNRMAAALGEAPGGSEGGGA